MAELKNYVLSALLWNCNQEPDMLIQEFLSAFYGPVGADYVQRHMQNMHGSIQRAGCNYTADSYSDGCLNSCCDYPPGELHLGLVDNCTGY